MPSREVAHKAWGPQSYSKPGRPSQGAICQSEGSNEGPRQKWGGGHKRGGRGEPGHGQLSCTELLGPRRASVPSVSQGATDLHVWGLWGTKGI